MPPNVCVPTGVLSEDDSEIRKSEIPDEVFKPEERKLELVWLNIIIFIYLHIVALYGVYLSFTSAKLATTIFACISNLVAGMGITAGAHRLWCHKTYKAKWPLKVILVACNTMAFQNSVIEWSKDHRVHHKFSESDADPHNAKRGFFFAHIGWLLCRKHPDVKAKGKTVDFSDLYAEPLLVFQSKYYLILMPLICFILPTLAPMYFWNETFGTSFTMCILRYVYSLHCTWFINSWAHMFGNKPYDKNINPSESLAIAVVALGEGWHNYHHTFPWDYKTSELGTYSTNFTTAFIDFFAKIGWAYDLKTVSDEMIKNRVNRTGDGTHNVWGWEDKDLHIE